MILGRRWSLTPLRRLNFADEIEARAYWITAGGGTRRGDLKVGCELALLLAHVVNVLRGGEPAEPTATP